MKTWKKLVPSIFLWAFLSSTPSIRATPSTHICNPSTDIQARGIFNLNMSNGFSIIDNERKPYASGTDMGLNYGPLKGLELGIDLVEPSADPLSFNLKYGLPEGKVMPAIAIGGFNFGTKAKVTNYNIFYGIVAKSFAPAGRFSLGYYQGNGELLINEAGEEANSGVIATWDRTMTDKIWVSVDYASGKSFYGFLGFGGSYAFAKNTSITFAFVTYNNDKVNLNNQITTQLNINF